MSQAHPVPIRRALLSVSDKTGLIEFARGLATLDVEILSTGGTAAALRRAGLAVTDIAEFTGFPEMLDGRIKTLHPKVHGGLLFRRDLPEHRRQAEAGGIVHIDLVAVNLYPFRQTVARPGVRREEAIEQIDIGGPSMLRSAAKNHDAVTVVPDPRFYDEVLEELRGAGGATTLALRRRLAVEVFRATAEYDRAIAEHFAGLERGLEKGVEDAAAPPLPARLDISLPLGLELRYGENPHQAAAFYGDLAAHFEKLHGKDLSYNNLLDLSAAVELIEEFAGGPAAAIIKHTNPCGVAVGESLAAAWESALATDKDSANGGIVAFSETVDAALARIVHPFFTEIIAAPSFAPEALAILAEKKSRMLIRCRKRLSDGASILLRSAAGGVLAQEADRGKPDPAAFRVVTRRAPSASELRALTFGWKVVKHLKSNAIAFTAADRSLGLGAGQMSRVDAARIAVMKARHAGLDLAGAAVASDAFFPFADGLIACADAGATAFIQPGGSRRDDEVIAAADARGAAMVFTGERHFRH